MGRQEGEKKAFYLHRVYSLGNFHLYFRGYGNDTQEPSVHCGRMRCAGGCGYELFGSVGNDGGFGPWTTDISNEHNRGKLGGALAVMPVFATIFGAVVSGLIIDQIDFFAFLA